MSDFLSSWRVVLSLIDHIIVRERLHITPFAEPTCQWDQFKL